MSEGEDRSRLDRELMELLNELRVALPGVQVLFAFLLTVPFAQRFERIADDQRAVFFGAFLATAVALILLMTPTAYHRLRWRQFDKERMLRTSNRLAIAGLASLTGAVGAVVYLIGDVVYSRVAAVVAAAVTGLALGWFWFALPLKRRAQDSVQGPARAGGPAEAEPPRMIRRG